jgi:hypothetical protein
MRLALIAVPLAAMAACGGQPDAAGPERRSAAGEVLGGEVNDDMVPLDSVRSASPAGRAEQTGTEASGAAPAADRKLESGAPKPPLTAAPMPDMTMPADPPPLRPDPE